MKVVKYFFLGLCVLIAQCYTVMAQQQVSIDEAQRVAAQTMNLRQSREVTYDEVMVKKVNSLKNRAENTLMYEVIFDDGHGVLLSGSKACLPVLGYYKSEDGQSIFDEDVPDGLKFLLGEYKAQIELCF